MNKEVTINFDGSYYFDGEFHTYGCGWVISIEGKTILQKSFGGNMTEKFSSNAAEYLALKDALEFLRESSIEFDKVNILGDSRLVINQLTGRWEIRRGGGDNPEGVYAPIAREVKNIIERDFECKFSSKWIPREKNELADQLSKAGRENRNRYDK